MKSGNNSKLGNEFARGTRSGGTSVINMQIDGVTISVTSDGSIFSNNGRIATFRASETVLKVNNDTLEVSGANIDQDGVIRGGNVKLNGRMVMSNCEDGVDLGKLGDGFSKVYGPAPYRNISLSMRGPRY